MKDLVLSNGDVTIRISAASIAQKSEREVRELVRYLYSRYYLQPTPRS